jgi:CRISPR/Cas system Type II protein with McrA/HNH and RuvC-like nuclease domain
MKIVAAVVCSAILALASVAAAPHLLTFKGTVVLVEKETIKMNAVDPETKKVTAKSFFFDDKTKFLRGDKVVKVADAKILKGESISVTVDHDLDEDLAQTVRLGAAK